MTFLATLTLIAYNYCTLSYTMAGWGKPAWTEELDRLQSEGYNVALMTAGVKQVWALTLKDMGYTREQIADFICDDAAQAWWLMGNMQCVGDGTPEGHYPIVTDEDLAYDEEMGRWMVREMRKRGIEPIFQGYVGLLPSLSTSTPLHGSNIIRTGYYCANQKSPDVLDPTSPAFKRFSEAWNKNLIKVYDLTPAEYPKYLGGDLFQESHPPKTMTEEEKVNCAKFVQAYQQAAFPGVTWVLQSWQGTPDPSLRKGLDPKHTLIEYLDQTMSYTGARDFEFPWVWAEVMNFGGNTGMYGAFKRFRALGNVSGGSPNFRGFALMSEGLETNPINYAMFLEHRNISDEELEPWMESYRLKRYGYTDDNLKKAYTICANTCWNPDLDQQGVVESVFCAFPSLNITSVSAWGPVTGTPYDPEELMKAADYFDAALEANPELWENENFKYDWVDIHQQVLADRGRQIVESGALLTKEGRTEFRELLKACDETLAKSKYFTLDYQLSRIPREKDKKAYIRMITTWTPSERGQTILSNYAHRSYSGLMKDYYAKRWNKFLDLLENP